MLAADRFHVSAQPDTLYDTLGVAETASARHVRKIASAIRRDAATAEDMLHEVCLANEVLGDPEHKAQYDRLLARMRAAGAPMPKIGPAMEGSRLGPGISTRVARTGGELGKALFGFAIVIGFVVLVAMVIGGSSGPSRYGYEPIKIPELHLPQIDYSKLYVPAPVIDYQIPELRHPPLPALTPPPPRVPAKRTPKRRAKPPAATTRPAPIVESPAAP